jgi:putative transcriptional regulator
MANQNFSSLTGKILIARPFAMEGNVFHKSLIYVAKHTEEGAIGFIFNHPVKSALAKSLFNKIEDDFNIRNLELNIHIGGPVEVERGFFLHSGEYDNNLLFKPEYIDQIAISSNVQILKDLSRGSGPRNSIFVVGYTGWGKNQLEFELEKNLWISAEPDHNLIFSENNTDKWLLALRMLGLSYNDFIPDYVRC